MNVSQGVVRNYGKPQYLRRHTKTVIARITATGDDRLKFWQESSKALYYIIEGLPELLRYEL